ncbi:hypothetical protein NBM05_13020 [Rothia sp. AR01]|uniref:Uncharacterized protein n=1 Tax=Rothia santali TaxID=2949643 RepID=A0A9X2HHY4_9MICC|nr:hypothetical protein [Rothia santali]MCP3426902.1 hypothetical protein [Rothia santali]
MPRGRPGDDAGVSAEDLLAGPRGRRLLLEYAVRVDEAGRVDESGRGEPEEADRSAAGENHPALDPRQAGVEEPSLQSMVWSAAHALDPDRDRARPYGEFDASWDRLSYERHLAGPTPGWAAPTPDEVAARLAGLRLTEASHETLVFALADAAAFALYWQEPDGADALAATGVVREGLRRVAEHLATSPLIRAWSAPASPAGQAVVRWPDEDASDQRSAREALLAWRADQVDAEARAARETPRDPAAAPGGDWTSTPPWHCLRSTRRLSDGAPAGLYTVEDDWGCHRAEVRALIPSRPVRLYEIDGPGAWARLCREFPLAMTAEKRCNWYLTTGRDGRWVVPDWSRVAEHWDAVHLTTAAYLAAAGTAIAVDAAAASVIAGWNPDETIWLTDAASCGDDVERWGRDADGEDLTWRPVESAADDAA